MHKGKKYFAIFFFSIFTFYIIPKEFIHYFYGHDDTIDVECTSTCAHHFQKEHQHCPILKLTVPAFISSMPAVFFIDRNYKQYFLVKEYSCIAEILYNLSPLRAPPVR